MGIINSRDSNSQEQEEKDELLGQLQLVQPNLNDDTPKWIRSTTGFTTSSLYNFVKVAPYIKTDMQNIWKIKVPPQVQFFAWLMLRNSILTTDNLIKRGWQIPNICHICKEQAESVHHLFSECKEIKWIREYIHDEVASRRSLCIPYKVGEFYLMLDIKEPTYWRSLEVTTCFVVWRERCARIFRD